jgi:hypothetical protein
VYSIDLTHYLDARGSIAPERGPARRMAEFVCAVVAHASDFDRREDLPGPVCFKSRKREPHVVETALTEDDLVAWSCPVCAVEGRISHWQDSFWDLSSGTPSA